MKFRPKVKPLVGVKNILRKVTLGEDLEDVKLIEYMKGAIDYDEELLEFCRNFDLLGRGKEVKLSDIIDYKVLVAIAFDYARLEYIITEKNNVGELHSLKDLVKSKYNVDNDDLSLISVLYYVHDFIEKIEHDKKNKGIFFDMVDFSAVGVEKFGGDFLVLLRDLAFMYRFNAVAKIDDDSKDTKLYFTRNHSLCTVIGGEENFEQMKVDTGDAYFVLPKNLGDKIIVFDFIRWK